MGELFTEVRFGVTFFCGNSFCPSQGDGKRSNKNRQKKIPTVSVLWIDLPTSRAAKGELGKRNVCVPRTRPCENAKDLDTAYFVISIYKRILTG